MLCWSEVFIYATEEACLVLCCYSICYTFAKCVAPFSSVAHSELEDVMWCVEEKPQYISG